MKHSGPRVQLLATTMMLLLLQQLFTVSYAAIQCSDVLKDLAPCISYLRSGNGSPSSACCSGVSSLASAASTSNDRRTVCSCIQSAAQKIKPSITAAQALPGSCGVILPFAVSPNVDCSKIS